MRNLDTSDPVSINVNTDGIGKVTNKKLVVAITRVFDLTHSENISWLKLMTPVFLKTTVNGYFGRDEFTWEKLDYVNEIANVVR